MWEKSIAVANSADFNKDCGGDGQPLCELPIIPSCDSGLLVNFGNGTCVATLPIAPGDFNEDGCVDRSDLDLLLGDLRDRNPANDNLSYDLNENGRVDALDSRLLVTLFTHPRGVACSATPQASSVTQQTQAIEGLSSDDLGTKQRTIRY